MNSNSKILCELSKLPFDELPRAALSILKSTLGSTIELSSGEAVFLCQAISGLSAGWTSPNPCVGAVVCDSGGKLLGYGWHEQYGKAHAEKNAIDHAHKHGHSSELSGATIYVSLEPCNHQGNQPPCCGLIAEAKIKRVVYVSSDPNRQIEEGGSPSVFLAAHGVEVVRAPADDLLRLPWVEPFLRSFDHPGRPYVCIKAAVDQNFKMGSRVGKPTKITGDRAQKLSHFLRQCFDGILIGRKTLLQDSPGLTVRNLCDELIVKKHPVVFVVGFSWCNESLAKLNLLADARSGGEVIASCQSNDLESLQKKYPRIQWIVSDSDFESILKHAKIRGVESLLVEGGASVHKSMLESNVVDRVFLVASRQELVMREPTFFPVDLLGGSKRLTLKGLTGLGQELVSDFH